MLSTSSPSPKGLIHSSQRTMPKFVRLEAFKEMEYLLSGSKSDIYTAVWTKFDMPVIIKVRII